jgi:hypothetical protein
MTFGCGCRKLDGLPERTGPYPKAPEWWINGKWDPVSGEHPDRQKTDFTWNQRRNRAVLEI